MMLIVFFEGLVRNSLQRERRKGFAEYFLRFHEWTSFLHPHAAFRFCSRPKTTTAAAATVQYQYVC